MFRRALTLPIRFYRRCVSPFLPHVCRFYPSCSQYALEAVEKHGVVRGGWLASKRFFRCHPLNPGGYDPVPEPKPRGEGHGRERRDESSGL